MPPTAIAPALAPTTTTTPTDSRAPWVQLQLPATPGALAPLVALLQAQAQAWGFDSAALERMQRACEQTFTMVLRLGLDRGDDASDLLQVHISAEQAALQLRLSDNGLPYDLSVLPCHSAPLPAMAHDPAAVAMQALAPWVDRCQILDFGPLGQHLLLQWMLPSVGVPIAPTAPTAPVVPTMPVMPPTPSSAPSGPAMAQAVQIRAFEPQDAAPLAQLMFRTFGDAYTHPDMHTAQGIQARVDDGRMTSWVAVAADGGAPIGHVALLKAHADDAAVEIGSILVAPDYRGAGLMARLIATAQAALTQRRERVVFVHASAAHPFVQKILADKGYHPTALLLGLIPGSGHFRGMAGRRQGERSSAYHCCKLLRPVRPQVVYLPAALRPLVVPRAQDIGLPLIPLPVEDVALQGVSILDWQIEEGLGVAFLTLSHAGDDLHSELPRQLRKLCRAQIDVIYLSLHLGHAGTPAAWAMAQKLGFIPCGLMPFMPWPATLCLQYLNNQTLHESSVRAVGAGAEILRAAAFADYRARELL